MDSHHQIALRVYHRTRSIDTILVNESTSGVNERCLNAKERLRGLMDGRETDELSEEPRAYAPIQSVQFKHFYEKRDPWCKSEEVSQEYSLSWISQPLGLRMMTRTTSEKRCTRREERNKWQGKAGIGIGGTSGDNDKKEFGFEAIVAWLGLFRNFAPRKMGDTLPRTRDHLQNVTKLTEWFKTLAKPHRPCTLEKRANNLNELWMKTTIITPPPTVDHRNFKQPSKTEGNRWNQLVEFYVKSRASVKAVDKSMKRQEESFMENFDEEMGGRLTGSQLSQDLDLTLYHHADLVINITASAFLSFSCATSTRFVYGMTAKPILQDQQCSDAQDSSVFRTSTLANQPVTATVELDDVFYFFSLPPNASSRPSCVNVDSGAARAWRGRNGGKQRGSVTDALCFTDAKPFKPTISPVCQNLTSLPQNLPHTFPQRQSRASYKWSEVEALGWKIGMRGGLCASRRIRVMSAHKLSTEDKTRADGSNLPVLTTRRKKRMQCGEGQHYHHRTWRSYSARTGTEGREHYPAHGARGKLSEREMDVDDMPIRHTLSIRLLLVYRLRLAVDDATWFSGVST
ncbi:hypothetical protein ARMGADRAFT_1039434 [Armillaria gallica]|uniref:Uncharacterized protein n=1 Tax=Armillaria gallica TaxID=47427 RepID=A0A2H3CWX2_ARMGA|nr:hypothetical protein ARMGADRAFT_1039434 [Armillaria gallica]